MNKEEKEAIERLKEKINKPLEEQENILDTFLCINIKEVRIFLNLIDKQQKEIEELKFSNKILDNCLNDFYGIKD